MGVTYAPDAHDRSPDVGPKVQVLPFFQLGDVVSVACQGSLVGLVNHSGGDCLAVVALAVASSKGKPIAIHLNLNATSARRVAASLIEAAGQIEASAGVQ